MNVSQLAPAASYPNVQAFVAEVLDAQFGDVRGMLQLPHPEIGIEPACNFAIVSTLCNLISGISTTIYKPANLLHEFKSNYGSGKAFKDLVRDFFPYIPAGAGDFPEDLYQLCRNPLAHSVTLRGASTPVVTFTRVFHSPHADVGWSDQELEDLERPDRPQFDLMHPAVDIDAGHWTLHCDSFYLEVIAMLRQLNTDAVQMQAAENRFSQGVHNWRLN